jgi:hypothetical protein
MFWNQQFQILTGRKKNKGVESKWSRRIKEINLTKSILIRK